jgi:hypothetical protein
MRRFALCEHKRVIVAGAVRVHARLRALRCGEWPIVGVFQLDEGEWTELAQLCSELGIAVTQDVEESAIQT